jgi:hypothetical protein
VKKRLLAQDDAPDTDQDDEDEVEKRVAEETAKYRDAQAKRLEEASAKGMARLRVFVQLAIHATGGLV